jgi:hypothetical protein
MTNNELLDEIELAVSNKAHLHVEDKRRLPVYSSNCLKMESLTLAK